jgi:hypothetical protein
MSLVDLDKAESDLMQDIIQKLKDFPDISHQDDDIHHVDLPIESQLNVDCD